MPRPNTRPLRPAKSEAPPVKPESIPEITPEATTPVAPAEPTAEATPVDFENEEAQWEALIAQETAEREAKLAAKAAAKAAASTAPTPPTTVPPVPVPPEVPTSTAVPATNEDAEIAELERKLAERKAKRQMSASPNASVPPSSASPTEPVATAVPPTPVSVSPTPVSSASPQPEAPAASSETDLEAKHQRIAKENNLSDRVFTDNGTDAELAALVEIIDKEDQRTAEEKEAEPSPDLIALGLCDQIGQRTRQQHMLNRFINDLDTEKQIHFQELEDPSIKLSKINSRPPRNGSNTPVRLTGDAARLAVISRTQGLYRIMLYNSGFWITIHIPSVADAAAFVHEVDADFQELGRIIGGQFHLVLGAYLKHKVLEILPSMVVNSNLQGYTDAKTLGEAISIQDYDTILWGICCAMYRDGLGIGVHCTNPECRHIDTSQFVDLTKACYINPEVFNETAMIWMRNTRATRSLEDCIHYRNDVLKGAMAIEIEPGTKFSLRVPSFQYYADKSVELVGKMEAAIYKSRNKKNQETRDQLTVQFYKMLAPWIARITYLPDEPGYPDTIIEDYDAICTALEAQNDSSNPYYDKLESYIRDTKCTIYVLTTLECPKCHKRPNLNNDGLFPLDLEYLFFALSCRRLEQTGMTL